MAPLAAREPNGVMLQRRVRRYPYCRIAEFRGARAGTPRELPLGMTKIDADRATDISDRRMAALRANGDDQRNTVAWQDACSERRMIQVVIGLSNRSAR